MTTSKQTPLSVTRDFARQHPAFSGRIAVETLAPKGRGGRLGMQNRCVHVLVSKGQAALEAGHWSAIDNHSLTNGLCEICGTVYLDKQVMLSYAPDPGAGETIECAYLLYSCTHAENAPLAHVMACEACRVQHGLRLDGSPTAVEGDTYQISRPHPSLVQHSRFLDDVRIDMRGSELIISYARPIV